MTKDKRLSKQLYCAYYDQLSR